MKSNKKIKIFGNNYHVIQEIGRGGMGVVYSAEDKKLKRKIAIKNLDLSSIEDDKQKDHLIHLFNREAIAIAKLNHPNIVNIYDIGEENATDHYIVMELIDGQSLSRIFKLHPLIPEIYLGMAIQICDALHYIHENGVIHRDIKPENIILSSNGVAKLTDFGVAKYEEEEEESASYTKDNSFLGTLIYMSPEQLQNSENIDGRADIYSFAATLYEILTGTPPFYSEDPRTLVIKILGDNPIPPSNLVSSLPESLDRIILKALSKNRDDRYADAYDFLTALKNIPEYKEYIQENYAQFKSKRAINLPLNTMKNKSENVILSAKEKTINNDLLWLEQLDSLMKEGEVLKEKESTFIETLSTTTIELINPEYKMLVKTLKSFNNINETIRFLSSFDNSKTLRDILEGNNTNNFFTRITECIDKDLFSKRVLEIITSLNFVIKHSPELNILLQILKKFPNPKEIIYFLDLINTKKVIKLLVNENYSMCKLEYIFNILYEFNKQDIIQIKSNRSLDKNENIFIGDMLVAFSFITKPQLNLAIREKEANAIKYVIREESQDNDRLGETLIKLGFLDNDKLFNALKLQPWYKKFFSKNSEKMLINEMQKLL